MLQSVVTVFLNAVFMIVLHLKLYSDRFVLPGEAARTWRRSPVESLQTADMPALLILQYVFVIVSVVSAVLVLFGVKSRTVRIVRLASAVGSAVMFVLIMIVSASVRPRY